METDTFGVFDNVGVGYGRCALLGYFVYCHSLFFGYESEEPKRSLEDEEIE